MKRTQISSSIPQKWRTPILLISLISLLLLFTFTFLHHKPHLHRHLIPTTQFSVTTLPPLPKLAYLITGTGGESKQLMRLLQALYHPRNYYILHLDLHASNDERLELSKFAKREAAFRHFRNVMVLGKADLITAKGPTAVAATLHGVAILLKVAEDWDWFINLSVYDYPLFSQDDFLHILSYLPRDLNFLQHTSDIGWKENQRARPIIIDPGLYHAKKSAVFWAKEKRSLPSSFKLFAGSYTIHLDKMADQRASAFMSQMLEEFALQGADEVMETVDMVQADVMEECLSPILRARNIPGRMRVTTHLEIPLPINMKIWLR